MVKAAASSSAPSGSPHTTNKIIHAGVTALVSILAGSSVKAGHSASVSSNAAL